VCRFMVGPARAAACRDPRLASDASFDASCNKWVPDGAAKDTGRACIVAGVAVMGDCAWGPQGAGMQQLGAEWVQLWVHADRPCEQAGAQAVPPCWVHLRQGRGASFSYKGHTWVPFPPNSSMLKALVVNLRTHQSALTQSVLGTVSLHL
jgi:hypothetical protein